MRLNRYFATLLLAGAILFGAACENIALIRRDSPVSGARRDRTENIEVVGTVEDVDTRAREIYLRTGPGTTRTLSFGTDTRVIIRGREYPVSELRRDDEVTVQLAKSSRAKEHVNLIRVRDRGRTGAEGLPPDSGDGLAAVQTIEGTVERVDLERGYFEVRPRFGNGVTRVFLPYRPGLRTEDEFRRLREGDYVRVQGEVVTDNRVELKGFL
jgi:hypothetical protein